MDSSTLARNGNERGKAVSENCGRQLTSGSLSFTAWMDPTYLTWRSRHPLAIKSRLLCLRAVSG